ncbi:peptidase [Echinicola strongylocentroti]|uniref:Peptidase n=1 Tax=Echinicola strongylocentroti TaxID=1795355 RepID=A0A2Z4ILJ4_9BACT|nr:S41 family peptidase [Echinicola strongylocentroti]AWW31805.1 peptidase [Echinicola strongylocentroti]
MKISTTYNWLIALVFIAGFTISCSDRETEPNPRPTDDDDDVENPNIAINEWIWENMNLYYYWVKTMNDPIAIDSQPEKFFDTLLVKEDGFSVIYPNYEELVALLGGVKKEAGYEYTLFGESESNNNVIGIILYVKKGSPAEAAGIKRNDRFNQINGTTITRNNYLELTSSLSEAHSLTISRFDPDAAQGSGAFAELEEPITTNVTELTENPIFMDSIYTIENKKIGYLVYNFFAPGPNYSTDDSDTQYDQQLDDIFADFKAKGINELILDLRYNGGGYVTSAINLASLIGKGVSENDIFSKTAYNEDVQAYLQDTFGPDYFINKFKNKSENIGNQLESGSLHVITSEGTASSSELIINGLMPYMNVNIIGDQTYGKNVGSITIQDEENEDNQYGLLPIISKSFNSLDQSDYSTGFVPDIKAVEHQKDFIFYPLGDINETLLEITINDILGKENTASSRYKKVNALNIGGSTEASPRFGRMIESTPDFK